jgi:hypothetical protein
MAENSLTAALDNHSLPVASGLGGSNGSVDMAPRVFSDSRSGGSFHDSLESFEILNEICRAIAVRGRDHAKQPIHDSRQAENTQGLTYLSPGSFGGQPNTPFNFYVELGPYRPPNEHTRWFDADHLVETGPSEPPPSTVVTDEASASYRATETIEPFATSALTAPLANSRYI